MSPVQNIFVTGISGSVGHYLFDTLANDSRYHLYLLVRNRTKLKRDLSLYNNVTLIEDDLQTIHRNRALLQKMDYVVLIATCWGGYREPWRINVYSTFRILRALNQQSLKKVIYFSTASILDRAHRPVEAIRTIGTNYIRSKFLTYKMLQKNNLFKQNKITILFPTWVYGGDSQHPFSHAAQGLTGLRKIISLAKHFTTDFSFHFIHCQDIASIVKYLLENDLASTELVLGNVPLSIGDFLKQAAVAYGQKMSWQISVPMWLVRILARIKGSHPWDIYCLKYKHFVYTVLNSPKLKLPTDCDTVAGVIASTLK